MLGSNPSADSAASTDRGGMLQHPFFIKRWQSPLIGTGIKAINPGGCGGKAPAAGQRPALSFHDTVVTLSFLIAMEPDRAEPLTQAASAF
jgi:hypothetical protein